MKVRSLVAALGKLENLLRRAGETDGSRSVNQFIPLFQGYDGETVASFVTKLTKRKPPLGQATISPPVQQLRAVLTGFEEVLRDAEAPRSADDIAKLCDILDQCGQASIDQLVRDGREWLLPTPKLLPAPKPVKTSRSKKAPAASVPTMAPSAYAASLTEATSRSLPSGNGRLPLMSGALSTLPAGGVPAGKTMTCSVVNPRALRLSRYARMSGALPLQIIHHGVSA